jgi:hypothetical protein
MVPTVPTSNPQMGELVEVVGKMSNNGNSHAYESGDDDEIEKDDVQLPIKRRGCGLSWRVIAVHPTLLLAFDSLTIDGSIPRLKGRTNRGKTSSYYYSCTMKSCGCTKQWRFVTALDSSEVAEEESAGDHSHHDELQRNGGRGLSFDQVKIVDEIHAYKIKRPLRILEIFTEKAKSLHGLGMLPTG